MESDNKIKHIAIVPDGNRRWATEQGKKKIEGHTEGAQNIRTIAKAAIENDIECLTIWIYSTENLQRSKLEVAHLLYLSGKIAEQAEEMNENNIKLEFCGDLTRLPKSLQKTFQKAVDATSQNTGLVLTLAAAYGGRDDIVRAAKHIAEEGIPAEQITEDLFSSYIDLSHLPPIDLVIRTGKKKRLSGFFSWQTTYSELYFTDTYWPVFSAEEFKQAIDWFNDQKRTMGK